MERFDTDDFLDSLARDGDETFDEDVKALDDPDPREIVLDSGGKPRQAGAGVVPEGEFISRLKKKSEENLFTFAKGILGKWWLYPPLHKPVCDFLQDVRSAPEKLLLMPREHSKTVLVSHSLPIHINIQPKDNNIYYPGRDGSSIRILLAGETGDRAEENLQVIKQTYESNELLKALWPEKVWDEPNRQSPKWSNKALILPRKEQYADPSIRRSGVGVAVTGSRTDAQIKDDLCTYAAANSAAVMQEVISWFEAANALQQTRGKSLSWTIGTHWATYDLYVWMMEKFPDLDKMIRSIVEDGEPILPPDYPTLDDVERKRQKYGLLFNLMYMNQPFNEELTDFQKENMRTYAIEGDEIVIEDDHRDLLLADKQNEIEKIGRADTKGVRMSQANLQDTPQDVFLRLRYD